MIDTCCLGTGVTNPLTNIGDQLSRHAGRDVLDAHYVVGIDLAGALRQAADDVVHDAGLGLAAATAQVRAAAMCDAVTMSGH